MMKEDKDKVIEEIASHYRAILKLIGEDPDREGLLKTPQRAAKAIYSITSGYNQSANEIASKAIFQHDGKGMVIVKDIEFYSMCEHHILPFFGKVCVGYLPKGKILGLSKLARIVDVYAKRLQVQERLTAQICREISNLIPNDGVIVACEGAHLCMKMRGVEKQDSSTLTFESSGKFNENPELRKEFMTVCGF
ncbi:MAG: GTP cyclohydrolase I FolE [Muribaculaceae bacterium]|nr:GTP cyclohydrolase I FolE [Muribaculaceae bacterium]